MKIFSASNPTEAHIICGLLESENIACEVRGEGLFGLKGEYFRLGLGQKDFPQALIAFQVFIDNNF